MIFEKEDITFQVLDVLFFDENNTYIRNSGRNYHALSFRTSSDTEMVTEKNSYHLGNNWVCFVPRNVDYTRIAVRDTMIVIHLNITNDYVDDVECFAAKNPDVYRNLFEKVLLCWKKKEAGYKYRCAAIVNEILEACYLENRKEHDCPRKIKDAFEYLIQNYRNPTITIGEIAEKSHMSEVYFRKLFKEYAGICPQKYIINLRIQYAISLIQAQCYMLKEIAYLSGFHDYKHFSAEFKRNTGVSPSRYCYRLG